MGGQKGIALFYDFLSKEMEVTLISAESPAPASFKGDFIPVLGSRFSRYANPALFKKVRNIIKNKKCTHIFLEHPYMGWLAVMLKRSCGLPLAVHSHNIESLRFKSTGRWWWRILWQYEKWVHQQADFNFFITDTDCRFAIKQYGLEPGKCHTITYGIEQAMLPLPAIKCTVRENVRRLHQIAPDEKILFFNGTLSYKPNLDAVDIILQQLTPLLEIHHGFKYKIIICGKDLPDSYQNLEGWKNRHVIYAGFVDEITNYFLAADIFINPVMDGGGIKTKLVEALGFNVNGVSTVSGAIGITPEVSGSKLTITPDGDWQAFVAAILNCDVTATTPPSFYSHFYWGNIAQKVKKLLIAAS